MKKRIVSRFLLRASHSLHFEGGAGEPPHGHHYHLAVSWGVGSGHDLTTASEWIKRQIVEKLDGRALNKVLPQSSGEEILLWVEKRVCQSPYKDMIERLSLEETQKNSFQKSYGLRAK